VAAFRRADRCSAHRAPLGDRRLTYFQIVLGAAIRHTGAGLVCTTAVLPRRHLAHRRAPIGALAHAPPRVAFAVLALVSWNALRLVRGATGVVRVLAWAGPVLVAAQIALGIVTILTFKDLLPVTAHLLVAALLLADLVSLLVLTRPARRRSPPGSRWGPRHDRRGDEGLPRAGQAAHHDAVVFTCASGLWLAPGRLPARTVLLTLVGTVLIVAARTCSTCTWSATATP